MEKVFATRQRLVKLTDQWRPSKAALLDTKESYFFLLKLDCCTAAGQVTARPTSQRGRCSFNNESKLWTEWPSGPSLRVVSWVCHANKQIAFYVSRVTDCHNSPVCTLQAVEWTTIANSRSTLSLFNPAWRFASFPTKTSPVTPQFFSFLFWVLKLSRTSQTSVNVNVLFQNIAHTALAQI